MTTQKLSLVEQLNKKSVEENPGFFSDGQQKSAESDHDDENQVLCGADWHEESQRLKTPPAAATFVSTVMLKDFLD